jgi:hypothetical protein
LPGINSGKKLWGALKKAGAVIEDHKLSVLRLKKRDKMTLPNVQDHWIPQAHQLLKVSPDNHDIHAP